MITQYSTYVYNFDHKRTSEYYVDISLLYASYITRIFPSYMYNFFSGRKASPGGITKSQSNPKHKAEQSFIHMVCFAIPPLPNEIKQTRGMCAQWSPTRAPPPPLPASSSSSQATLGQSKVS